jgi:hypothetical protein
MQTSTAGKRPVKKIVITVLAALAALILAAVIAVFALWHNEIATLMSFTQLRARNDAHEDGSVYYMEVKGGFYLDEFVAQGGVSSDSELISFITEHITKGLIDMGISESEIACSSFTATTEDGHALFARNYDFDKTNTCIVKTEANEGRHASISTVDLQFLSIDVDSDVEGLMDKITCLAAPYVPLDGVNDAGVSCGIYMTYQGEETVATDQNTDLPDFTSTTLLRLILDYASSVEEAVEIAQSYDLHDSAKTSYHYMVADSTGKSAILEWVGDTDLTDNDGAARRLVVTYNDDDAAIGENEGSSDYQWVTNFILQPDYYESDSDKAGLDRYDAIYEALSATDGVVADEQAAMDILALVGRRSWNADGTGCTVHSVVYDLTEKTALWVSNENYDDPTAVFTFRLDQ